jgi:hypothetical protein
MTPERYVPPCSRWRAAIRLATWCPSIPTTIRHVPAARRSILAAPARHRLDRSLHIARQLPTPTTLCSPRLPSADLSCFTMPTRPATLGRTSCRAGCGRRAAKVSGTRGCDIDHDVPWPDGPTCGCNNGPLCRRHHRVKQLGWVKQRRAGGHVRWTSPLGRRWLSRGQHQPPPPPVRPLPPLPATDPLANLTDRERAALWDTDPGHAIFDASGLREAPDDIEPLDTDTAQERFAWGDLWTRLDDPTAWHPYPDLSDHAPH